SQARELLSRFGVPDAGGPVRRCRDNAFPFPIELRIEDPTGMPLKQDDLFEGFRLPNDSNPPIHRRDHAATVGRELRTPQPAGVRYGGEELAALGIPDARRLVERSRHDAAACTIERRTLDPVGVTSQN